MTIEELLIKHEGIRLKPYLDTVGKLSIGIGRNLTDVGLHSQNEALYLLQNDLGVLRMQLDQALPWWITLDEVRQLVVLDMAFNLGVGGLLNFKVFLSALREGRHIDAAVAMIDSVWAVQVKNRAIELARMMRTARVEV